MNKEKKYTDKDIGKLVSIPHFADRQNRCEWSGCPTWRQAYGVIVKVFEDNRAICIVEGTETYFFTRELVRLKEEK